MTSVSPQGRFITATFAAAPALAEPTTQHALRRYRRRAYGTLAIGIAALLSSYGVAGLFDAIESGNPEGTVDGLLGVLVFTLIVLWAVGGVGCTAGVVSVVRAAMMARWLARAAWEEVAVRVGHSGGTGMVLLPEPGSPTAVPTEPYAVRTRRGRLEPLQGAGRIWIARPGRRSVVLLIPGGQDIYVASRSWSTLLRRWHRRSFASGLPITGGG